MINVKMLTLLWIKKSIIILGEEGPFIYLKNTFTFKNFVKKNCFVLFLHINNIFTVTMF